MKKNKDLETALTEAAPYLEKIASLIRERGGYMIGKEKNGK